MFIIKHTVETTASPAAIWCIWQDVSHWKSWDHALEFSQIDGPFQTGATGILKAKGGPRVKLLFKQVEPMKLFINESKLPFARIIVSHSLKVVEGKTHVTHAIEMRGPLAFLFAFLIGRGMKKNLPRDMETMVRKAETCLI
ncbi:MAG TPA: SRPBCC family protein [Chlamydiales bacterium]|nr:SRPBCC family protein [Chlamydiales bacterium]